MSLHRQSKKQDTLLMPITSRNIDLIYIHTRSHSTYYKNRNTKH